MGDYFHKYHPRLNKSTNKLITFKSEEQYFTQDFEDKNELQEWFNKNTKDANYQYLKEYLLKRKEYKGIKKFPSQFESKSLIFPVVSFLIRFFGEDKVRGLAAETGLSFSFDYKQELEFNNDLQLEITIDTRENKPLDFNCLYKIQKLEQGDYKSDNSVQKIVIDRKSLNDCIGTLSQGFDRFQREIERAEAAGEFLVMLVEHSYNDLRNFNSFHWMRHAKVSPDYILHRIRELLQKYSKFQVVCVKSRDEAKITIEKLFRLKNNIETVDLQYFIDSGSL